MKTEDALMAFIGYRESAVNIILDALVRNLVKNGALKDGQIQASLQEMIERAGSESSRADYQLISDFVRLLNNETPSTH